MFSILLAIIYIAFISLGLPDSLLGSAWPVMQTQLGVPLSYAGIISMIIAGGTVISSLLSDRLNKKFGTGLVTAVSVFLTAAALFGFSVSKSFWLLCVLAIPYGFGAGAVDAALNNYVALHYSSRHMSWLHCFWGVGAAVSPYIMSYFLTNNLGWNNGYRTVSVIQMVLTAILFISLPLWRKKDAEIPQEQKTEKAKSLSQVLKIKGVKLVLVSFFCYCAAETTSGLWASSYLVLGRGLNTETAAKFASFIFIGITLGRFLCGFFADKIGDKRLIRFGLITGIIGIVMMIIPLRTNAVALTGLIIMGFGFAPVYPSVIHSTPQKFGKVDSQAIIGVQMASAYIGSTFMPPLFGLIAQNINVSLYPVFLLVFISVMMIMTELLNKKTAVD